VDPPPQALLRLIRQPENETISVHIPGKNPMIGMLPTYSEVFYDQRSLKNRQETSVINRATHARQTVTAPGPAMSLVNTDTDSASTGHQNTQS